MPLRSAWIAVLSITLLASISWAAPPTNWRSDYAAAYKEARTLNRPLLIHFYSSDCGPCVTMERTTLHHADVEQRLAEKLVGVSINVSNNENVRAQYKVNGWPTDIIIDPLLNERIAESGGMRSAADYTQSIDTAVDWYHRVHARPTPPAPKSPALQLGGYCPVTLLRDKKWVKGNPQLTITHEKQVYNLSSPEAVKLFQAGPEQYVPQFRGYDPVVIWDKKQHVLGSTRYAAFYDDQLYLFESQENRDQFKQTPDRYLSTRVVLDPDLLETIIR